MLNSGFRGKRATDGTGAISVQNQSLQATYPIPKINSWSVTDGNYVPLDDTAATSGVTIVVYGTGFVANMSVLVGNTSVVSTLLDSGRITFTAPALGNGTYNIYIVTTQGGAAILSPGIVYSGFPTWTTSTYSTSLTSISIQLLATGDAPLTYSLQAGSTLPTGITLTSTGILTGTATGVTSNSVFYFTVIVDDAQAQSTQQLITLTFQFGDPYFNYTPLLLNGETTVTPFISDASTNSFPLTIAGDTKATSFNPYQEGYYSNYFDGTGDYLNAPANTAFAFGTGDYTLEFWVYSRIAWSSTTDFFNTNNGGYFLQYATGTGLQTGVAGVSATGTYAVTLTSGAWNHIAISRASGSSKCFVNGIQVGTTLSDTTNYTQNGAYIAALWEGSQPLTGYISNLRVVKGTALYTAAFTPPTTPLTAISGTSLLTCQSNRFIDNSTNAFAITKNGDTTVSSNIPFNPNSSYSTYGSAYFDGTGDYITGPSNTSLITTGQFTMECWVYTTTLGADQVVFENAHWDIGQNGGFRFTIKATTGYIALTASTGTYNTFPLVTTSTTGVTINTWNHVAMTRDSSNNIRIFLNGALVNTPASYSSSLSLTSDANVGTLRVGIAILDGGAQTPYTGYISNLRLIQGTAVYTSTFTPPTTPLTAIANTSLLTLQYNGGANNSGIIDNGPFQNVITRNGNTSQGTFSPYSQTGWSVYFNGSSYLEYANQTAYSPGTGDFTLECWVYHTVAAGSNTWYVSHISGGVSFYRDTAGKLAFAKDAVAVIATSTNTLPVNAWTHVAVARSSTSFKMFINGSQEASVTDSTSITSTGFLDIGVTAGVTGLMTGYISNIRLVKGTALYTSSFTPSTTPLTAVTNTQLLICQSNRFVDNSPNNFTVNAVGGTTSVQAFSPFGSIREAVPLTYSNYFDGTGDYLSTPDNVAFTLGSNDFTFECWVYPTSITSGNNNILAQWGNGNAWIFRYVAAGRPQFTGAATNVTGTTTAVTVNQWNHIAITRTSTTVRLFVNGVMDATTGTIGALTDGASQVTIGAYSDGTSEYVTGYISNLRLINGTSLYTSTFTPSTTPLTAVANTVLLTCQSTTMIDNSSNAFALTANGDVKPNKVNPFGYTNQTAAGYSVSVNGGSVYFDGTGDYMSIANNPAHSSLSNSNFTLELWFYTVYSGANTQYIISHRNAGIVPYLFWIEANGGLKIYVSSDNGSWNIQNQVAVATVSKNQWYHLAYTRNGSTFRVFLNGVQTLTFSNAATFTNTTNPLYIGGSPGDTNAIFNGYISDVRFTKEVSLYNANFIPSTQSVTNYSANNPSGVLLNFNTAGILDYHSSNVLETLSNAQLSTSVKKYGNSSMSFNGTSQYITTPYSSNFSTQWFGDGAIECWVYFNSVASTPHIWSLSESSTTRTSLYLSGAVFKFYVSVGTGSDIITSATTIVTGQWYHVAITRSGTTWTMWLNGVSQGTSTSTTRPYGPNEMLSIGTQNYSPAAGDWFNGYIDDLRITKGFARYTANFTPPTALVAT